MGQVRVVALMGPTAAGKARLAREAAAATRALLVSCDSMKVYRDMDLGTAKPAAAERGAWIGLDLVDPWERFDANRFRELFEQVAARARSEGRPILLSGGTMLYVKAATEGLCAAPGRDEALRAELEAQADQDGTEALHARLQAADPAAAARIHPHDRRRLVRALEVHTLAGQPLTALQGQFGSVREDLTRAVLVVRRERADMDRRIDERVDRMLAEGWVEECRRLLADPRGISREARQALGYRQLWDWLEQGEATPLEEVVGRIKTATRRFARQQLTWLKRLPDAAPLDMAADEGPLAHLERLCAALAG